MESSPRPKSLNLRDLSDKFDERIAVVRREVEGMRSTLEDYIMPINKYTRPRAAVRGSQLFLPGVIKAVASNFNYKRIYQHMAAGGKRLHSTVIVVDVSQSTAGGSGDMMRGASMQLLHALESSGYESPSFITYAGDVRIVKTEDMAYDGATKALVVEALAPRPNELGSCDADAIHVGLDILEEAPNKHEKHIFIFTDGFSSRGLQLAGALSRADTDRVDVVAIDIGGGASGVSSSYSRWIRAAVPSSVPLAVAHMYEQQGGTGNDLDAVQIHTAKAASTIEEVLKTPSTVMRSLENMLNREETEALAYGGGARAAQMDICFVIDCTGSMEPYLHLVKEQVKSLPQNIKQGVKEKLTGLKLDMRMAVVPYRDINDGQLPIHRFYEAPESLEIKGSHSQPERKARRKKQKEDSHRQFVAAVSALQTDGGDDPAEDLLTGLHKTLDLNWNKNAVKFVFVITDAPAHRHGEQFGSLEIHDLGAEKDKYWDKPHPKGYTVRGIVEKLKAAKIDMQFCHVKRSATMLMDAAFRSIFNSDDETRMREGESLFKDEPGGAPPANLGAQHFVLALDGSGSMSGEPWNSLMDSVRTFVKARRENKGQGESNDLISIVLYNQ